MGDDLERCAIRLGREIVGRWPIPRKAVDAYLAWNQGDMSYAVMVEIVCDCMMRTIAPLLESEDPSVINFRTGLSQGFFERVADGVREFSQLPVTGDEVKARVLSGLETPPGQFTGLRPAAG